MADGEIFTGETGQGGGLVVSTGILGDLVLPASACDPDRADELRELAALCVIFAERSSSPRSWRAPETVGQLRLLQSRTRILNGTLHELFTLLYPAMPASNVQPVPLAAAARAAPRFLVLSLD
jgi:hypothetical protein